MGLRQKSKNKSLEKFNSDLLKLKIALKENNKLVKRSVTKKIRISSTIVSENYWDWKKIVLNFKNDSEFAKKYPKTLKSITDDSWKITSNIHLTLIGVKNLKDPTYYDIFKHSLKNTIKVIDEYAALSVASQMRSGHAIPLRLDFASEKIVYPLKISSVVGNHSYPTVDYEYMEDNEGVAVPVPAPRDSTREYYYDRSMGILIYVITDNKQALPKFDTLYAGWVSDKTIEELAYDDEGDAWLEVPQDKYFLTKLYRRMRRSEMTNDLFLRQASNNDVVNASDERDKDFTAFIWVMIAGGIVFLVLLILVILNSVKKE